MQYSARIKSYNKTRIVDNHKKRNKDIFFIEKTNDSRTKKTISQSKIV